VAEAAGASRIGSAVRVAIRTAAARLSLIGVCAKNVSSPGDSGAFSSPPSTPLRYVLGYHDAAPAALFSRSSYSTAQKKS
jgi:hypothetical protein